MKKLTFFILFFVISEVLYAQQWVQDEIADEQRGMGSTLFSGIFGMLLLFGFVYIIGYIADSWKARKSEINDTIRKNEEAKKNKIELERKESELRVNAIPSPVDLGLSVKWANFNIGAYKPSDIGKKFYWAKNVPSNEGEQLQEIDTYQISDISGIKDYDAATYRYGVDWRIPTNKECQELIEKCEWKFDKVGEISGFTVVGPNGNSIFIPFTEKGYRETEYSYGCYWSSTPGYKRGKYNLAQGIIIAGTKEVRLRVDYPASCLLNIRPVFGDLVKVEENHSVILSSSCSQKKTATDNIEELYKKYENQSYIRDDERKAKLSPFDIGPRGFKDEVTYTDEFGVVYSIDGKRLLSACNCKVRNYHIKEGTEILCQKAFLEEDFLLTIFNKENKVIKHITIPSSVCYIAPSAFPDNCVVDSFSPYYDVVDDLLIDKRKLCVIKCLNKYKQKAFVPAPIVSIENYAFRNCEVLRQVFLPDTIISIKDCAFWNCSMLDSVTLPDSIQNIGESAFAHCNSLNITSLPKNIRNIGNHAFYFCKHIEGTIPTSIDTLGVAPFPKIESDIRSSSPNYSVRDGLLINNTKKSVIQSLSTIKELNIPEDIICIEKDAFSWSNIESVIIPPNIKSIGDSAFSCCDQLVNVEVNKSIKKLSNSMFSSCKNLERIQLPDWVEEIGDYAFKDCAALSQVTLPDSLVVIGVQTFAGCLKLESITIPANVERIGILPQYGRIHEAFYNCNNLKKVTLNAKHLDFFELPNTVQIRELGEQAETIPSFFFRNYESIRIKIPHNIKEIKAESFNNSSLEN